MRMECVTVRVECVTVRMRACVQLECAVPGGQEQMGSSDERGTAVGRHAAARAFISHQFEQVGPPAGVCTARRASTTRGSRSTSFSTALFRYGGRCLGPAAAAAAAAAAVRASEWRAARVRSQLFRGPHSHGVVSSIAKYHGIVAVGMSSGAALVLAPGTVHKGGAGGV